MLNTVGMAAGVITADSTGLTTNSTYTLTASIVNNGIQWTEGGGCQAIGLC